MRNAYLAVMAATVAMLLATANIAAAEETSSQAVSTGDRRELFVDRLLVDRLDGAELMLHAPQPREVVVKFDRPWEGPFVGYITVMQDDDRLRLYYRGRPKAGSDGSDDEVTCYAESRDGVHWEKPHLRLYEVAGTLDNNVVLANATPASHNFCPFKDANPDCPADARYKALGGISRSGLIAFVSADAIRWRKLQDKPVFTETGWAFDSQNVAFWSAAEKQYVLYYRKVPEKVRAIARSTSQDFRNWSKPEMMTYSDTKSTKPSHHLYVNQTHPYVRAPHVYLGVAARFMPGRRVVTDAEAKEIGVAKGYAGDSSDVVLLSTRGGNRYEREFGEAFVRPGLGAENWVSRTNYPALGIVQTAPGELSLYIEKNYGQPTIHLRRYTLRTDGFASVRAGARGGELVTKPLRFDIDATAADKANGGKRELELNFATSAAGSINVEIQDEAGQPIEGFTLTDADMIVGDRIAHAATWRGKSDVGSLAGRTVRLRFVMQDADVYSLRFRRAE
jgi:hypothetical protein